MEKRRIALLGATGYTGQRVLRELLARGEEPTLAGRNRTKMLALTGRLETDLPVPEVDVTSTADRARLPDRSDVVLSTVGPFMQLGIATVPAAGLTTSTPSPRRLPRAHRRRPVLPHAGVTHVTDTFVRPSLALRAVFPLTLSCGPTLGAERTPRGEVGPRRGAGLSTGPFPRAASRTRRAPLNAPGSPQAQSGEVLVLMPAWRARGRGWLRPGTGSAWCRPSPG